MSSACDRRTLLSFSFILAFAHSALGLTAINDFSSRDHETNWKSATFLSPKFSQGPGSVQNKFYFDVDFPRGHIAIKEFNAEVVDEAGNSVPLHETYLHHWLLLRYYEPVGSSSDRSKIITARNSGVCQNHALDQYFGLGSETRRTETYVPGPYGIEVGNPAEIPDGYEEKWLLNVHAIDTRGVENRLGCTECRCDLYNVTQDEYGSPIAKDYVGGLYCCYDETRCTLTKGFEIVKRGLYLKYTVRWVDWVEGIVPVRIYIFDVTDTGKRIVNKTDSHGFVGCQVEYTVEPCDKVEMINGCIDSRRETMVIPRGGDVIYGVAHQHTGGIGSALYGQDGRVICSSLPIYGHGNEAGNEAGYIVGMTTCYPQPGSVKVLDGETLTLESNYSRSEIHTGVMGLFYILVADPINIPAHSIGNEIVQPMRKLPTHVAVSLFACVAIILAVGTAYILKKEDVGGYQILVIGDHETDWKSAAFLSPKFSLGPGSVQNKYYRDVDFPRGHIAIKQFNAEVVDEEGNPVPLYETYIHHWLLLRYYEPVAVGGNLSKIIVAPNSGVCRDALDQYFGLGSETRRTETHVPGPYGIEVGNPAEIPDGYKEKWMLNVHAIDTRGVENRLGCTECRCDLYNVTQGGDGTPLPKHYLGGLSCCYDGAQCRLRKGLEMINSRGLYLKYTVKWADWDVGIVPVRIYILDVTDIGSRIVNKTVIQGNCQIEYDVDPCEKGGMIDCIDSKRATMEIPHGGDVIYGVAHQHIGAMGSVLYGQDGRVICSSKPIYGHGRKAGDEAGYVVGMTTCYPQPGSIKVWDGETLALESNYSSSELHTGVMGLFYLLVAEPANSTAPRVDLHAG
ncbi:hypothetical protein EJ110_NYTH16481 [Nymphaea thermarum]|nr:hypothetical protein EJ110_NYTH16481 [Nymphaea thermarum]